MESYKFLEVIKSIQDEEKAVKAFVDNVNRILADITINIYHVTVSEIINYLKNGELDMERVDQYLYFRFEIPLLSIFKKIIDDKIGKETLQTLFEIEMRLKDLSVKGLDLDLLKDMLNEELEQLDLQKCVALTGHDNKNPPNQMVDIIFEI